MTGFCVCVGLAALEICLALSLMTKGGPHTIVAGVGFFGAIVWIFNAKNCLEDYEER